MKKLEMQKYRQKKNSKNGMGDWGKGEQISNVNQKLPFTSEDA